MNKITFDQFGNPSPYSIVALTYNECKNIFVDNFQNSNTRQDNWNNFFIMPLKSKTVIQ